MKNKLNIPDCENCICREFSLLNHCTHDQLQDLNESKTGNLYKKGQVIFFEGNRPYGIFCVNEGKIKITKETSDGKEQIIRLAKEGDVLGYRALMADAEYSATAVALDDSKVCFIPKEDFTKIVDENARLGKELMKLLSKALGTAENRLAQMALKPVRERVAEALILLEATYSKGEKDFSISISREDFAGIVGTAKETAIRFLSELKEENVISTQGSTITILDKDKLLKISSLYD